jgi:hypothetical protein
VSNPGAKAQLIFERFSAGLKSSFPLLPFVPQGKKQGAPTKEKALALAAQTR